jgi:hypothetical protein
MPNQNPTKRIYLTPTEFTEYERLIELRKCHDDEDAFRCVCLARALKQDPFQFAGFRVIAIALRSTINIDDCSARISELGDAMALFASQSQSEDHPEFLEIQSELQALLNWRQRLIQAN